MNQKPARVKHWPNETGDQRPLLSQSAPWPGWTSRTPGNTQSSDSKREIVVSEARITAELANEMVRERVAVPSLVEPIE